MEFTINKDGMSLDIEMFASKKLLSNYVEKYISTIMEIQKRRELKTNSEITYITNDYVYLSTLIEDHLLSCGTDWSEIEEKYSYTKIIEMLNETLYKVPYSEEELNHIYCNSQKKNPYLDVAIKRLLFSVYNTYDVQEILKMLEKEEKSYEAYLKISFDSFKRLLKLKFEDKNAVIKKITEEFEEMFNKEFNCGGYALEIFDYVLCDDEDKDVMVSKVLANPSVRLLGDSLLQDDEYLVVLDATNYHFIKYKDGKFFEKMNIHPIGEFEGWPQTGQETRDLVYFAVKKEHDMNYRYNYNIYSSKYQKVLTFDDLVFQAIENGEDKFEYHSHSYTIRKNEEGDYDIISSGELVGEALIEEKERIVVIKNDKKEYVRNTRSKYYESMHKDELSRIRTRPYPEKQTSRYER